MQYEINGKTITCSHCGGDDFHHEHARMDIPAFFIFEFERIVDVYVCSSCGKIEWFTEPETEDDENEDIDEPQKHDVSEPVDCLSCGSVIPAGESKCPACGMKRPLLQDISESIDCLSCGSVIPAGESKCPACGWTYDEG